MPTQIVNERPVTGRRDGAGTPGRGGGSGPWSHERRPAASSGLIALGGFLSAVVMLFIAFTSAYVTRRQEAGWPEITLPWILWLNTAVLLGSSAALEWGRARLRRGDLAGLDRGLRVTAWLGIAFVVGQLFAWRSLARQGVYLASNPHSSFFYLLTGMHGLHLLGGLAALAVVSARSAARRYTPAAHDGLTVFTLYWHFMDGLWLYVFALLFWA
jgi:cytochrome c oxidase subunit III